MPTLVATVGSPPDHYTYGDVRLERRGFLSVYSFHITDHDYRNDLMYRRNAVVVMPANMETRELYMIEQPRHLRVFAETEAGKASIVASQQEPTQGTFDVPRGDVHVLEMPAGIIDPGESPVDAAARELFEETGIRASRSAFEVVAGYYPSLGGSTEHITAYLARLDDSSVDFVDPKGDGHEQIFVWRFSFDEAFELLGNGRIKTASCGLLLRELKIRDLEGRR